MKIVLVRHAEAGSVGDPGVPCDADRPLTEFGRATAERLSGALATRGYFFDALVCSPLLRARLTGEPLKRLLKTGTGKFVVCDGLAPDSRRPESVLKTIEELNAGQVLVVGHLPDIAVLAGMLIGAGARAIEFDKGTAACFDCGGVRSVGVATLTWLLSPEWY